VIRGALLLASLAALAAAGPDVGFVDGTTAQETLVAADATSATLRDGAGVERSVPTLSLVHATLLSGDEPPAPPMNLHLWNGDRLRGSVEGAGDALLVSGPGFAGLRIPLDRVKAVRFGALLAGVQETYQQAFAAELDRNRDVVIVQRGTSPFPMPARVLAVEAASLRVRVGDEQRDLPLGKAYGFVRALDRGAAAREEALSARLTLSGGARLTIALERIDGEAVVGGGARVARAEIVSIEFLGPHLSPLGDLEPIDSAEVSLFGKAPPWRRDAMVHGGPLRLGGRRYERGIGVQARSSLTYALGGKWRSFFARCGIDDAAAREGAARFRVIGDGRLLREVSLRRGDPPAALAIDVTGVDRLTLEADPGESYASDFCDWAEARLYNSASD